MVLMFQWITKEYYRFSSLELFVNTINLIAAPWETNYVLCNIPLKQELPNSMPLGTRQ